MSDSSKWILVLKYRSPESINKWYQRRKQINQLFWTSINFPFAIWNDSIPMITFSDMQEQTFLSGWLQYCLHYPNLQNLSYWPIHVHQIQADFGQLMSTETEHCNATSHTWQSGVRSRGLQNKLDGKSSFSKSDWKCYLWISRWHLEFWSPNWLETSKFSFLGGGGGGQVALVPVWGKTLGIMKSNLIWNFQIFISGGGRQSGTCASLG